VVYGAKWLMRYGRSKNILIVGQARAGKTSLFRYMQKRVIYGCNEDIPMTRTADKESMFRYQEKTEAGEIDVEVRLARDLSGQTYPDQQAKWFLGDKPHILFVFVRFDQSLEEDVNDINNVRYWVGEFFSEISDQLGALDRLVRITFVVTRIDQVSNLSHNPGESQEDAINRRRQEFKNVIQQAYEKIPNRKRRALEYGIYYLQMCHGGKADRQAVKSALDSMRVESFVKV
jgi:hypothetical protein